MASSPALVKVVRGEDRGKRWTLNPDEQYMIGRSRKCSLRLSDPTVSGVHAKLECQHEVWFIADLDSTHGTAVNDTRITGRAPLFDRDVVRLGKTLLEFREYEAIDPAELDRLGQGIQIVD